MVKIKSKVQIRDKVSDTTKKIKEGMASSFNNRRGNFINCRWLFLV